MTTLRTYTEDVPYKTADYAVDTHNDRVYLYDSQQVHKIDVTEMLADEYRDLLIEQAREEETPYNPFEEVV
jgi:hypothetical protein